MHLVHCVLVQACSKQLRMALGKGQQHVRAAYYHAGRVVVLTAQKHLSSKSPPAKFDVDQAGTVAAGRDLNMALRQISIQVEFVLDVGMAVPGDDHEGLIEEPLVANAIAHGHGNVESQVN